MKHQAPNIKHQAASSKHQASAVKNTKNLYRTPNLENQRWTLAKNTSIIWCHQSTHQRSSSTFDSTDPDYFSTHTFSLWLERDFRKSGHFDIEISKKSNEDVLRRLGTQLTMMRVNSGTCKLAILLRFIFWGLVKLTNPPQDGPKAIRSVIWSVMQTTNPSKTMQNHKQNQV